MKKRIPTLALICLSLASSSLMAQTAADDKALNQKLRDNSAAAQKILDDKGEVAPTTIKILSNKGSSSTKSKTDLTDQDKQLSENFINQAAEYKIRTEKCAGDMQQVCNGNEGPRKVMGMDPGLIKAIGQAYATVGAMSDSILPISAGPEKPKPETTPGSTNTGTTGTNTSTSTTTNTSTADAGAKKPDADAKEKPTDYCKYIPTFTETIAMFAQKNTVQALNNGGETSQKEALLKAAKSHDGRAEQAQTQAVGWFGGAACYAVNAMTGNFATDKNLLIKMGAAAFLGYIYQGEVSANKEYADKTREIAQALPSKGDCNPITENECYCATPEYANDPTYCREQIARKNAASAFSRLACTDNLMKLDPNCNCEKTNTCFDKVLENQGAAALQIGMGYGNSPFKSVVSLARGKLEGGTLGSSAYAGTQAIAKKALNDLMGKIPGNNSPLNPGQKAVSDAFASKGIPLGLARLMAQNSPPKNAIDSAMAKTSGLGLGGGGHEVAAYSKNNVVDFTGGNGLGLGGKKAEKKSGVDDILGKLGGKTASANNGKVLEFAQKAQERASQITTKTDRPLFEIISNRYQLSGRRLLQLETNN